MQPNCMKWMCLFLDRKMTQTRTCALHITYSCINTSSIYKIWTWHTFISFITVLWNCNTTRLALGSSKTDLWNWTQLGWHLDLLKLTSEIVIKLGWHLGWYTCSIFSIILRAQIQVKVKSECLYLSSRYNSQLWFHTNSNKNIG